MAQTMTSKILARASGREVALAGDVVLAKVEMLASFEFRVGAIGPIGLFD